MKLLYATLIIIMLVSTAQAYTRPISYFDDIKIKYWDYQDNLRYYTNKNLAQYPEYLRSENVTHYILQRGDDVLTIQKNLIYNGSFNFRSSDISFTIVAPASKVAQVSQANGSGQRRIKIPESARQTYKRFTWDNKLPVVVLKNQTWNKTILQSDYWYSKQNGNLWFNFKTVNVTGLPVDVNASFYFDSWIIDNSTTSGWQASNISTNGYWSAYGGGSVGTPLNQSIHTNLSLYVDCEAISGTTQYGINRFGRFSNTSIQGTWYGNTTLNYTAGQNWGSACSFDDSNDYITGGLEPFINKISAFAWIYPLDIVDEHTIIQGSQADYLKSWYLEKSYGGILVAINGIYAPYTITGISPLTWNIYGLTYDNTTRKGWINNSLITSLGLSGDITNQNGYRIGRDSGGYPFNGSIDEIIIDLSDNPIYSNSTYATSFNLTMNQTASAGYVISTVRFNVPYLNTLNNTANISVRQNGTITWTQVSINYQNWTWVNFTGWAQTDILFEGFGNGSARMFVVNGEIAEFALLSGYVNNTLGLPIVNARIDVSGVHDFTDTNGYYSLGLNDGMASVLVRAIGYQNKTETVTISGNTSHNFVLFENIWSTEEQVNDAAGMGFLGGIVGGALVISVLRRKLAHP